MNKNDIDSKPICLDCEYCCTYKDERGSIKYGVCKNEIRPHILVDPEENSSKCPLSKDSKKIA